MLVRNHAIDRMARWMATGLTTAGLSMAVIPLAHGGPFPAGTAKRGGEQSLAVPGARQPATPSVAGASSSITPVGLRRQPPRQAVVIAPAQPAGAQPAAPVYVPQPMYFPNGAPATQVPQQFQALQDQNVGQETAVSRELRRLYEDSGRTAPQLPGMQQPQPAAPQPVPQYVPAPGYAPPPGYVAAPGYAPQTLYYPQPGYAPAPGYAPQPGAAYAPQPAPGYAPQPMPGYAPYPAAGQLPASQPISTDPAEDPEFFPGDSALTNQLDGFEFEESETPRQPAAPQYQPVAPQIHYQPLAPIAVMPTGPQPQVQPLPERHGFAYPGPAAQQQPTPIVTAGVVPPNVEPPRAPVELPRPEELIAGTPIATDYEMAADPKIPKKGFLGKFASSPPPSQKPPVEPKPYIPNPHALLAQDDDLPLAPSADVPGPEQDPAMAAIANYQSQEEPEATRVVEELPPPVVTPGVRTLPVAAAATVGSAARRNYATELFRDETPAAPPAADETAVEVIPTQPVPKPAPQKTGGIAAGGFAPGKNVVPEPVAIPDEPKLAPPVETASADPLAALELADSAAPRPMPAIDSPYTGLSLNEKQAEAPPLVVRENRGLFFPPAVTDAEPTSGTTTEQTPQALPMPVELTPLTAASKSVRPVSQSPESATRSPERSAYTQSKYEQIAARTTATGLKGFCPVRLRDHRDLADGRAEFRVQHQGRVYDLSSASALQSFLADPDKYTPAAGGYDVVAHRQSGDAIEGVLDHSAWFKGRLYLFSSADNKDAFVSNPAGYAVR